MEVFFGYGVIYAKYTALEQRPEALNGICVGIAVDIFALVVINYKMVVNLRYAFVTYSFVGVECGCFFDRFHNLTGKRL